MASERDLLSPTIPAIRRIPQYLHKPSSSVVEQTFIYKIEISIIYNFKKKGIYVFFHSTLDIGLFIYKTLILYYTSIYLPIVQIILRYPTVKIKG